MKKKIDINNIDFEAFLDNALKSYGFLFPETDKQMEIFEKTTELKELPSDLQNISLFFERQNTIEITDISQAATLKEEKDASTSLTRHCSAVERTIVAGHIINMCNTNDFGRVKFQKLLYLVEHVARLDFDSRYERKAAGPHDDSLLKEMETKLKQYNFYKITQDRVNNKRVYYAPLSSAVELSSLFSKQFAGEEKLINSFLTKFKNSTWEQCEIVATLYAVWNNRIIKKQEISDALLKQDFLNWDNNKAKYKDRIDGALNWMKQKKVVPTGWGKIIE